MPKFGRPRAEVVLTDDERAALVRLTKRARVNRAVGVSRADRVGVRQRARQCGGAPPADDEDHGGKVAPARGLNLVERFFGLLTEKALKRGSHTSIAQVRAAILAYVEAHNERGTPFKWVKTADEILDNMKRFGLRIEQMHSR